MATKKQEKQETQVAILTPKKVRGTATIYACGDVEFKAYGEGTPQKEVIKRKGNSQLYETKPVKGTTPKLCAHLMVDKDDPAVGMKLPSCWHGRRSAPVTVSSTTSTSARCRCSSSWRATFTAHAT